MPAPAKVGSTRIENKKRIRWTVFGEEEDRRISKIQNDSQYHASTYAFFFRFIRTRQKRFPFISNSVMQPNTVE